MNEEKLTLYTIGHSNITLKDFLELLKQHHVTVLVDVRSAPYSRYVPQFNKQNLEAYLKENGVDYRFAGETLGGQPKDETVYKEKTIPQAGSDPSEFRRKIDYVEVMSRGWYKEGINRLLKLVAETTENNGKVAIMCSEGDPNDCHRHHLIARSLVDPKLRIIDRKVVVQHILKDGNIEIVDEAAFDEPPEQLKMF